jgi:hypothetical protein
LRPFQNRARWSSSSAIWMVVEPLDLVELVGDLGRRAVQLDHQHRPCPLGVVDVHRRLGRLHGQGVHHLDGRGDDPGPDDAGDGVAGLVGAVEGGQQGPDRLRLAQQPQGHGGGDAEGALGADEGAEQVVAGPVGGLAASQVDQLAVGQHHLEAGDVVGGEAVLEAVGAAGVLGNVAADGADLLAGRVGGVVEAVRGHLLGDLQVEHPRLDHRPLVVQVDLEDAAHAGEHDQHTVRHGQGPAGQAGARPAGHERHPGLVAGPHRLPGLGGRLGEHHHAGDDPEVGQAVAFVGAQLVALGDHPLGAGDLLQPADEGLSVHRAPSSL